MLDPLQEYETFLNAIPYMFENEHSKYLITHYLWDNEDKQEQLIIHLRLYDLVRRIFYIKTRTEPSRETVLTTVRTILSKTWMKNYVKRYITIGVFPKGDELERIKN